MIKKIFYCYRTQYRVNRCALLWGEIIKNIPKIIRCFNECGKSIFECCKNRCVLLWSEVTQCITNTNKISYCCNERGKSIFECCANSCALLWGETRKYNIKINCCCNECGKLI